MKQWQFVVSVALASLCAILGVGSIVSAQGNRSLQAQLQAQQIEINKGAQSQQISGNIVRDIALAATKNPKLKNLLERNGFRFNENPSPSPGTVR